MFEQFKQTSPFKRAMTLSAMGMSIGFGTCGVGALNAGAHPFFELLITGGSTLFMVSLAVMLVTLLVGLIARILEYFKS